MSAILVDPLLLLIPVIAGFIGWVTNVVAVWMMFHPLDFFGIRPWFGWQGIIPSHAKEMAALSTQLITTKLLNLRMLFERFDAEGFSGNVGRAMEEITEEVIQQTAVRFAPGDWEVLPDEMRDVVRGMIRDEVKTVTVKILEDMGRNVEEIIDVEAVVVEAVHRDRALIGEMFQTVGRAEFRFIKLSGLYFGFPLGIFQMFSWITWPSWWQLPFAGFLVGYVTNWLAVRLVFEPSEPKKIGPITLHGLFHKRQREVSNEFAKMVARDVLNAENIVRRMTQGAQGERLFGIVEQRMSELLDRYAENPMAKAMVPPDQWSEARSSLLSRVREELPKPGGFLHTFAGQAVDLYQELYDRMAALDSESFEGVLRPAFKKDEWKLIVAGGALGCCAGILQVLFLFRDYLVR